MDNTIEEKRFIIENRPDVEIVGIDFDFCVGTEGDGDSGDLSGDFSFVCDKAVQAEIDKKAWETIFVTFRCVDHGAGLPQKHVVFYGDAQIFDAETEDCLDYSFTAPYYVFNPVADTNGNFSVTVPMCLDETLPGSDYLFDKLREDRSSFMFDDVWFCNDYVMEKVGSILGNLAPEGEETVFTKENISYALVGECDGGEDEPEDTTH